MVYSWGHKAVEIRSAQILNYLRKKHLFTSVSNTQSIRFLQKLSQPTKFGFLLLLTRNSCGSAFFFYNHAMLVILKCNWAGLACKLFNYFPTNISSDVIKNFVTVHPNQLLSRLWVYLLFLCKTCVIFLTKIS